MSIEENEKDLIMNDEQININQGCLDMHRDNDTDTSKNERHETIDDERERPIFFCATSFLSVHSI